MAEPTTGEGRTGWSNLDEVLRGAARHTTNAGVYITDERGGQEYRTYAQVVEASLRTAAALRLEGVETRDRIMLMQSTGFGFLSAFFGAVAIGATPVPFPPPSNQDQASVRAEHPVERVARRIGARATVTDAAVQPSARPPAGPNAYFDFVEDVDSLLAGMPIGAAVDPESSLPETAYIQLTAGTTGPMRGVELTHANILSNVRAIGEAIDIGPTDVGVSWVPPYNPMGLVGLICVGLCWGIDLVLLHPDRFLKHPEDWLTAISRHEATLSTAPNFGYHYAVRRCQESNLADLDLSSWRVAMSGAEPVRAQHIDAFVRRFGKYGLRRDVFMPVYGLAEATLGVTFSSPDESMVIDGINRRTFERKGRAVPLPEDGQHSPAERLHLVSVGTPLEGVELEIVDRDGKPVEERTLGEIALRGPGVMKGYTSEDPSPGDDGAQRALLTAAAPQTRLEDGWLYTGDLGYVADGRLFVVGRASATIETARGRRIFAEEVELFVNSVDGVRSGSAVAFAVPAGEESGDTDSCAELLIVAYELQAGTEETDVDRALEELLGKHLSVDPHAMVGLSAGSVPKTHSGKVRRFLARELYRAGRLERRNRTGDLATLRRLIERARGEVVELGRRLVDRIDNWLS
ncbi:MAG: AMP-binding protein [Persicimonas sp.]